MECVTTNFKGEPGLGTQLYQGWTLDHFTKVEFGKEEDVEGLES